MRAAAAARGGPAAFAALVRAEVDGWVAAAVLQAAGASAVSGPRGLGPGERAAQASALALLRVQRDAVVAAVAAGIRARLDADRGAAAAPRPPAGGTLALTLIDESQIDEDIEVARIGQAVEDECEAELRQLTVLVSGLHGLPGVERSVLPLSPLACAAGLRDGLKTLVPEPDVRLAMLRMLGGAIGRELRGVYARLSDGLRLQGVQPARFRVEPVPARAPVAAPPPASAPSGSSGAATALGRLVELARQTIGGPAAAAAGGLRLLDDPLPAGRAGAAGLEPGLAAELMERLLLQVERQLGGAHGTSGLLSELREPARLLAARDPSLWTAPEHPWWQFLDRLLAVGTVHDDAEESGLVTRSLGLVVRRMRESGPLDGMSCQVAADGLQRLSARRLQERRSRLGAQARGLQARADAQDLQLALRDQILAQLRSTPTSGALRRFLVGPWAEAMTQAAQGHGLHSPELDALAAQVDALIRATARPGRPVPPPQRAALLGRASDALVSAGFANTRVEDEIARLDAVLRDPPPAEDEPLPAPAETLPAGIDLHGGLPTVPIVAVGTDFDTTLELAGHASWLDGLQAGDYCRMFLRDRWMNVQLSWVSPTRNLYVFDSRQRDGTQAMTRRMLTKLRNAGLATSIENGALLAMAADTLAQTDFGG